MGLESLTEIGGLELESNNALTSLLGLESLANIEGTLKIIENDALASLTGLENLIFVRNFEIFYNDALTSIMGLNSHTSPGGVGFVIGNSNLSICNTQAICDYLDDHTKVIQDNAPGCNSIAEVEAACMTCAEIIGINDQAISDGLYQAAGEINSTGIVPDNGTVNFKAGQVILLDNGFSVVPNADFSAEIEDCGN